MRLDGFRPAVKQILNLVRLRTNGVQRGGIVLAIRLQAGVAGERAGGIAHVVRGGSADLSHGGRWVVDGGGLTRGDGVAVVGRVGTEGLHGVLVLMGRDAVSDIGDGDLDEQRGNGFWEGSKRRNGQPDQPANEQTEKGRIKGRGKRRAAGTDRSNGDVKSEAAIQKGSVVSGSTNLIYTTVSSRISLSELSAKTVESDLTLQPGREKSNQRCRVQNQQQSCFNCSCSRVVLGLGGLFL